jgi:hypothetical protein
MLLPFDNTGGFTTAAAFLNSSDSQSGTLTLRFRDEAGALIGTGGLSLAPRNRQAFALSERFSAIANRRGVAEITSSGGELNVLGLRFNPRGAFTSFETVDIEDATDTTTRSVAQIADGNNWKTTMVLVNNGAEAAPFSLRFRNPNGATLTLPVTGYGAVSELFDVIPVGGSRTIETSGASMALVQGWAELTTPQSIGGTVVFRQRGVATDSEAVVRLMPNPGPVFVLPFDNTDGLVSAAALVNHADAARSVTVTFRDEEGREILTERLTVAAKGREAFGLPDQFPRLANQRGSAEFSGGAISVLGLRFNPLGSFTSVAPIKK